MDAVYFGVIKGVLIAGLGVFLAIALRWLPDAPRSRRLRFAAVTWCMVGVAFLLVKAWWLS